MRDIRDFRIGDLVIATSIDKKVIMRERIQRIGLKLIWIDDLPFEKHNVHRVKYKDQDRPMVYDGISDTREEMMVSRETIEYLEEMMNQ